MTGTEAIPSYFWELNTSA